MEEIKHSLEIEVDLSGNFFSDQAMEVIYEIFNGAKNLRVINLSSAFLGLDKEKLLHNLILLSNTLNNHEIQNIDLSGKEKFGKNISESTELVHLKMNNCGLGKICGNQLVECLM